MHYRIEETSTEKKTGETYFLVEFWRDIADFNAGQPPYLINDFVMRLRPTKPMVMKNGLGHYQRTDGVFVDGIAIEADIEARLEAGTITELRAIALERDLHSLGWLRAPAPVDMRARVDKNIQTISFCP